MIAARNGGNRDQLDGQVAVVRLLLEKGADVNAGDVTALHWAAFRGYTASIKLLLDQGADRNLRNTLGETPLAMMAQNPYLQPDKAKEVKALLTAR
jgi:ankyrin repeat protein